MCDKEKYLFIKSAVLVICALPEWAEINLQQINGGGNRILVTISFYLRIVVSDKRECWNMNSNNDNK